MKKIFILLLAIMTTIFANAQYQIGIGSTAANEEFLDSKYTADGGTINVGRITTGNDADCYIVKLNVNRQVVWQQRLVNTNQVTVFNNAAGRRSDNREGFNKVVICTGGYAVTGSYVVGNPRGFLRGIVCKFDSQGNLLWNTASNGYTGTGSAVNGQVFADLIETAAGNFAVVGSTDVTGINNDGLNRGILLSISPTGTERWIREYNYNNPVNGNNNSIYGINQLPNGGNIIFCGSRRTASSEFDNYETFIWEVGENSGAIISRNVYSINMQIPTVNASIFNSLTCSRILVTNNIVTIEASSVNNYGVNGVPIHAIFTYTPGIGTLSGNLYHNSPVGTTGNSAGLYTCFPLATNDYLIGETINTNNGRQNTITRANNGVITTRIMGGMVGNLGNITSVNGAEFNLVGNVVNGNDINGYSLFADVNLAIPRPNLCALTAATATVVIPAVITRAADITNLSAPTGMNSIILNSQNTMGTITFLCSTPPNPTPCPNDTTVVFNKCPNITIPLNVRTGTTYSWTPATGLSSTTIQNPTTSVNTNTTYVVTITNTTTNCTYRDTVKVIVNPLPISNIRDTSLCVGDTIQLNAPTGYTTYSWSPATNINNANISNPSVWPSATTNYIVTITNSFGCSIKDTVLVTVNNCSCEDSCNWSKTGNTFIKPTNFIGSKNNADFKVRTNNLQRMVVTAAGNIGLNTTSPTKTLDVNGEAVVRNLPAANPNDKVVLANATGELKSLAPGAITQYLSGNGTWQTLPTGGGGGTVTAADQGVTLLNNNTVVLGDECGKGGGAFKSNREININNQNLYFNASRAGKIYMGNSSAKFERCKELNARLEISSIGLDVKNDYATPNPSPSGLRFTSLTSKDDQIENKYGGVLSLDEDGDVIWVKACCNGIQIGKETTSILERLDKLEAELKAIKNENIVLKNKLNQTEIVLENASSSLEQNIPNPFTEITTIGYTIAGSFSKAVIVFNNANGQALKTVQLNSAGKGQIKIAASLVARGIYTYSLIVDGKLIETKKMIKE